MLFAGSRLPARRWTFKAATCARIWFEPVYDEVEATGWILLDVSRYLWSLVYQRKGWSQDSIDRIYGLVALFNRATAVRSS